MNQSEIIKKEVAAFFICAVMVIFYVSGCSFPGESPSGTSLLPPYDVYAELSGGSIIIRWTEAENADHYIVYRSVIENGFSPVSGGLITGTMWYDTSFPFDIGISYAVKSEKKGSFSPLSEPSRLMAVNSSFYFVQNISASVLSTVSGIHLSWDLHPEAEQYAVYRYNSKYDTSPVLLAEPVGNEYGDSGALNEKPYFYRVTWKAEGLEIGLNGPFVFGLYSEDAIDIREPENNDWHNFEQETTSVFSPENPLYTFSFSDGIGGSVRDIDWYKYRGDPQLVNVTITLTKGFSSSFLTNPDTLLFFQFFYNNELKMKQKVTDPSQDFLFYQSDFEGAPGPVDLYFCIFPEADPDKNIIETYNITITHEF
jgi:hypothetical protein